MEREDTYFFSLQLTWCSKSRSGKSRELEEAGGAEWGLGGLLLQQGPDVMPPERMPYCGDAGH